jgi:hypothetical protein
MRSNGGWKYIYLGKDNYLIPQFRDSRVMGGPNDSDLSRISSSSASSSSESHKNSNNIKL